METEQAGRGKVKGLQIWRNPVHFLAFGFGSGLAPFAPGTFGTVAGLVLYLGIMHLDWWSYLIVVLVAVITGVEICGRTASDLGVHDHPGIVWDEIAGIWITLIAAPPGWLWIGAGFVLFRVFDIIKPWPIGVIDRKLSGGLGIMLDDVIAGLFALACLQGLHLYMV